MAKYQKYAEYKDSGVEWLEDVPREWDIIKIKHLSTVKRGASPRPIDDPKYFDDNGEYAWVRIADVSASDMYLLNTTQTMSDLGSSLSVKLEPNQLFLSIAGTVGKPCINKIKACIHDGFVYFPELKIPNKYLFYVFAGEQAYKGLGKMGTQLNLNTDTVGDIKVALPKSQSDIYKIIEFLDHETAKIDTLIAKQEKLIELLKEKRQAVISHAVTKGLDPNVPMKDSGVEWLGKVPEHWILSNLKYFASIQGGYAFNSDLFVEEGTQVLRIGNVYQNTLSLDRQPIYISNELVKNFKDFIVSKNDVLMSLTGTLGKRDYGFAIKVKTDEKYLLNQRVAKISPNPSKIDTDFMVYVLWSESYLTQLYSLPSGTKQANLSNSDVLGIQIVVPPSLEEQKDIAKYLKNKLLKFDDMILKAESAISLMQERRTALISAAVTGKIDVRHWQAPMVAEAQTELSA